MRKIVDAWLEGNTSSEQALRELQRLMTPSTNDVNNQITYWAKEYKSAHSAMSSIVQILRQEPERVAFVLENAAIQLQGMSPEELAAVRNNVVAAHKVLSNILESTDPAIRIAESSMRRLRPDDDHYTLDDFIEMCKSGMFTGDDGMGDYATATHVSKSVIDPADAAQGTVNRKYTHVVWYNK